MVWLVGARVSLAKPMPMVLIMLMALLFFAGFYLSQRTGNPIGMLVILMLAAGALILLRGRHRPVEVASLTPEEEARLSDILTQRPLRRDPDAKPSND